MPNKQADVAIKISNKVDFKPKIIKRDRDEHYLLIKAKIQQDGISILKSIPQIQRAVKFVKEQLPYCKSHSNHTYR